jgi:hypothetical protein
MSSKQKIRKAMPRRDRITAGQFDAKFDAGEDISGRLDLSTARVFAPGEERLDLTLTKVNVDFPRWMGDGLDSAADRVGVPRQSLIKMWLAERLENTARYGARCAGAHQVN